VRILIVNAYGDDAARGGAERAVATLATHLVAGGTEVAYLQAFPSRGTGLDVERTVLHDTDWRDDPTRRLKDHVVSVVAPAGGVLEKAVARARPDLVHTHNLAGIGTGVWEVSRRLGVPVVHTIHDYYLLCRRVTLTRSDASPCRPSPLLCGYRTRRLARWAPAVSHVVGVSQHVLDVHERLFGHAELHVLRNPVPAPDATAAGPPREQAIVLGYIGTLDRVKGVHLLIAAAPRLAALGFTLRLAGDGRLAGEVAAAAEAGALRWEGHVTGAAKRRFLAECDVGLIPSVWAEPGGPTFTLVEWLAARRPVLVSARGGLGEVAGMYGGVVAVEPEVDAIVQAAAGLRDGGRWQDLVGAASPPPETTAEWVSAHDRIYRSLVG